MRDGDTGKPLPAWKVVMRILFVFSGLGILLSYDGKNWTFFSLFVILGIVLWRCGRISN